MGRKEHDRNVTVVVAESKDNFTYDLDEERRAVRLMDYTVLPMMTLFYLLSFLDRANIGNARVAGLQKGLGLSDHQYQICITVLYVPYILAELPSNLLLRTIGPNILMPTILCIWGMITALQGTVTSFAGLAVVRGFLGLVEGPMFPGIVLYLSGFYTRKELSLRIALFFSAASLSGAFSGLLAAAIENMDGLKGKPGWAWIFIIEGVFSTLCGLVGFFFVPATPRHVRGLTERQREIVVRRLERDRPTSSPIGDEFSFKQVLASPMSPQVILVFIALFMNGTTLYGLALFLPTIVNELGFSATRTQLISVGPFAVAFFVTLSSAYLSDKYQARAVSVAIVSIIAMAGFAMFLSTSNPHIAYGSLFLSVSGTYATPPLLSAWMANNSEPHYRRATSVALGFVATNAGGILSTWRYPKVEGPRYIRASILNTTFAALIIVFSTLNVVYLNWATKQKHLKRDEILQPHIDLQSSVGTKDKGTKRKSSERDSMAESLDGGAKAWMELGDRHPNFVYVT